LIRYAKPLRKRLPAAREKRARTGQAVTNTGFLVSSPVLSGILVTPQTALNFTSVFAAVRTISTDLACLPLETYTRTGPDSRVVAPEIAGNRLMQDAPNEEMNAFRLRQALMGHVLLWGNGYQEIVRNGRGEPTGLYPLNPAMCQPKRDDWTGKLYYLLNDNMKRLAPENVVHVAGLGFDGLVGYSAIHMAKQAVGLGMATEEFGATFFGTGATPGGLLKTPRKLSTTARQNLRQSIYDVHQGSKNAHNLMILEEGMEWSPTTMPLDDAQYLATRAFQNLEIARIYSMPPHKLGDYSQSHLANIEESNRNYVESTLVGWACAIEAEFDNKLLFQSERDRKVFWHHNFSRLNRANTQVRTTYYQGMRNMGAMNADEIRASEGLNPIGPEKGGDLFIVQGQYLPLDQIGKEPEPVAAAPKEEVPDAE
jgi:HK97 family phage portal protein